MKTMRLFSLLTLATLVVNAHAVKIENTGAWTFEKFENGGLESRVFEAEGALTRPTKDTDLPKPVIYLRTLDAAEFAGSANKAEWRGHILNSPSNRQIVLSENIFKKNGRFHYMAEYQTDTGTENMLHSALLATVIDGRIQVLVFDARRAVYMKQKGAILDLFKSISISEK